MNEWEMGLHHFRKHPFEDMVLSGETFTITRYGDPVAVCLPIEEYERLITVRTPMEAVDA